MFTRRSVSYAEARDLFAHPIVPCYDDDFEGYEVGVVSRNGDIHESGAFWMDHGVEVETGLHCLSATLTLKGEAVSETPRMSGHYHS